MSRVSRVRTAALVGVDGVPVEVEVRISSQLPRVEIVDLPRRPCARAPRACAPRSPQPARSSRPARSPCTSRPPNCARAALRSNLPIAVALLAAADQIEPGALGGHGVRRRAPRSTDGCGRCAARSRSRSPCAMRAAARSLIAPRANAAEAALADRARRARRGRPERGARAPARRRRADRAALARQPERADAALPDLAEVRGQELAKRGLEIAAAGGHGALLVGAPGCGQDDARAAAARLPAAAHARRGDRGDAHPRRGRAARRSARSRSVRSARRIHTASRGGLIGGGRPPQPGEVSLAHRGVLFLRRAARVRAPRARVAAPGARGPSRGASCARGQHATFPADFQLVAAREPVSVRLARQRAARDCRCDDGQVARYRARISGPLLDRIDLAPRTCARCAWARARCPRPRRVASCAPMRERRGAQRDGRQAASAGVIANARLPDASLDALVAADRARRARCLGPRGRRFSVSPRVAGAARAARCAHDRGPRRRGADTTQPPSRRRSRSAPTRVVPHASSRRPVRKLTALGRIPSPRGAT